MRVLIDARWVALAPESSHARYLRSLVAEWSTISAHPQPSQFADTAGLSLVLVAPGPQPPGLIDAAAEHVHWLRVPDLPWRFARRPASRLWLNTIFLTTLKATRPDVVFFPWSSLPATLLGVPTVVTVHDVCFRSHPEHFPDNGVAGDGQLAHAVHQAAHVLTPSQASREAILATYPLEPARISVVRHGIQPVFSDTPAGDEITLEQLGLYDDPYFLCVSTHEPRKNLDLLVEAFCRHVQRDPQGASRLVLVGKQAAYTTALKARLAHAPLAKQRTLFVEGISDPQLAALYRQARVVLAPSVCEGFGFPVVEALACGTPVAASDLGVFRELSGFLQTSAGLSFEPWHDAEAWARTMDRYASASAHATRQKIRARDSAASVRRQFAWRTSAFQTLQAFEQVARRGSNARTRRSPEEQVCA